MNIGRMNERLALQSPAQTNTSGDAYGLTDTYSALCTVWADVEQISADRRYMATGDGRSVVSYKVTLRWRDDVTLLTRLVWGNRYLYINDIAGDRWKGEMTLMCYEKAVG